MGKKNKGQNKSGFNKNTDTINYDEEMGRKTIGNLINGLDEDANEPPPDKPVVRAIRLNSQKANREKITTDFYDEDRATGNGDDIVTGFREIEEEPEENLEDTKQQEEYKDEEDPADAVRIRRPNILKDDTDEELDSRERYRRQFLEGYTDHERKRLELDPAAVNTAKRKQGTESSPERPTKRLSEEERELPPRRRPKEGLRKSREELQNDEQRPRRRGASEDEDVTLITKRNERKERTQPPAAAQPSYGAPIFKILALVFLILIVIIVVLVISLNSANRQVTYLEGAIEQFDEDVEELGTLRATNAALRDRNDQLTDENNQRLSQIEELERQLLVQGTDAGAVPTAPGDGAAAPGEGEREHVVTDGQTLYAISIIYFGHGRGADAIMRASGLTTTNIRVGDRLTIPATY